MDWRNQAVWAFPGPDTFLFSFSAYLPMVGGEVQRHAVG
jgi:hypothetical protein